MKKLFLITAIICAAFNFSLSQGLTLQLTPSDYNGFNISCFGKQDGSINLIVTGGTAPYTYLWSNEATTEDISGLRAMYYHVLVTDAASATSEADITLTEPLQFSISLTASEYVLDGRRYNVSCAVCNDGSITTTLTNGIAPLTYLWENSATTQNRSGLSNGSYRNIATDNNGCLALNEIYLSAPERTDWKMTGNTNTNPSTQFIGTTDAQDLSFRTDNAERLRIKANGDLKINSFTGNGNKMVIANDDGTLSTYKIGLPNPNPINPNCISSLFDFEPLVFQSDPNVLNNTDLFDCWHRFGLGTTTPQERLEVKGGMRVTNYLNSADYIHIGQDGSPSGAGNARINNYGNGSLLINYSDNAIIDPTKDTYINTGSQSGDLYLGNSNKMVSINGSDVKINGSSIVGGLWQTIAGGINYNGGNVGIGTTSTTYKLNVYGTIQSADLAGGSQSSIALVESDGSLQDKIELALAPEVFLNGDGDWAFPNWEQVAGNHIHNSNLGSVLIGKSSPHFYPQQIFEVEGNSEFNGKIGIGREFDPDYRLIIDDDVNINGILVIGTSKPSPGSGYNLVVGGKIGAHEIKVQTGTWNDFVFEKKYDFMSISDLEKYINKNMHLPGIPSQKEVLSNNGFELGDMQKKLLQKIEELTLYIIDLKKDIEKLKKNN